MDGIVHWALRSLFPDLGDGSVVHWQYFSHHILDDPPVLEASRAMAVERVVAEARVPASSVTSVQIAPDVLMAFADLARLENPFVPATEPGSFYDRCGVHLALWIKPRTPRLRGLDALIPPAPAPRP